MLVPLTKTIAAGLLLASMGFAQSPADQRIQKMLERWRWEAYWLLTPDLGPTYQAGHTFHALLFWPTNDSPNTVGFCSAELGLCMSYQEIHYIYTPQVSRAHFTDDAAAFEQFRREKFGRKAFRTPIPEPQAADYTTKSVSITLPELEPPQAIRDRKMRPAAEIAALTQTLACLPEERGCKVHLLIPYYSLDDPFVPVYRECTKCNYPQPIILFPKFEEGRWWQGATNKETDPASIRRTRAQIEKALMLDFHSPLARPR